MTFLHRGGADLGRIVVVVGDRTVVLEGHEGLVNSVDQRHRVRRHNRIAVAIHERRRQHQIKRAITLQKQCNMAMEDDMNTGMLIGHLLSGVTQINRVVEGKETLSEKELESLKNLYHSYVFSVLGLIIPAESGQGNEITSDLVGLILKLRNDAKANKDYDTADLIRKQLGDLGITVKDGKEGADWEIS